MKAKKAPENRRLASAAALTRENGELRARLAEAEETLRAIRDGEVDAVVVSRPEGDQVFTLQGAERTYRFLVEEMNEGALLLEPGGTILYANARFAAMAGVPLEEVSGGPWQRLFAAEARAGLAELLQEATSGPVRGEFDLVGDSGTKRPVSVSLCSMQRDGVQALCAVLTDLTERKAAEAALKQANEGLERHVAERTAALQQKEGELALILGSTPFMLTRCSRDLRYLYVSRAYGEMLGLPPEEIAGKPIVSVMTEKGFETIRPYVERVLRGERVEYETGVEFSKAGVRELSVVYIPDVDAGGQVVGWVASIRDVTDRNRMQEALRESEAMLARAQHVANLGSWQWDITTDNLVWSDQIYRILGLSAEHFRPSYEAFLSVVNPEDRGRVSKAVESALAGKPYEVEFRATRPDGVQRNVLAQGEVDFDRSGKPVRMIGTTLDITERKQAEEGLRQANERLAYHAQNTPLGVIEFDAELRVRGWSDGAQRIFGWEAAEVMGRRMWEIPWVCEEDRGKIERVSQALVSGGTLRSVSPNRNLRKDGQVVWCEWYNSSLTDSSGKMQSIQSLVLDVTKRKEAEAVLARDKEELQRLVDERTAKLQELVGELEHFSYTITHDLKSPLRAMRGFAEIMRVTCCECDQAQAKEFLGRISTSAERMDHLIADALNYSRLVRQELPLEDVDAGVLLRGMLDSYPEFQPAKATICVEGTLPVVLANEAGLTQCFSNLLGNAVKFVEAGKKPDIRVWASHRGEWVRIWVEDKGIGVSRDMLPRVFDMFSRGSKAYEGTGIGLALVRKVAQRMGGKVGVESEEGKGSRFWIELSCRAAEPVLAAAVARQAGNGGKETILYVEDEESDAMFMEQAFKKKGGPGKLRVVGDGRAAIQYLSGAGDYGDRVKYPVPALVLLDIGLPQVTGFGVLEWIRNNPDYRQLPVVMFSSSTRDDDRTKAKELGADEFVAKPSSGLAFGDVVEGLQGRWLGRRSRS